MKIERKHAKKLAAYLEDDMGWDVFPVDKMSCLKCRRTYYEGDNFCKNDGSALVKNKAQDDTIGQLLKGMQIALGVK